MVMFLSVAGIIGKTENDVVNSLSRYAKSEGGGLEKESLSTENDNCCVIKQEMGNTTVFNPRAYLEWDKSSAFISKDLNTSVFSFHIHDGDLWMYVFFVNGEVVDQFNPIPDYWEDNISAEEIDQWKGNALTISRVTGSVKPEEIEKYLVRWDLEAEGSKKAYSNDEFGQEDWQLLDFMRKLRLPYPLDDNGTPTGETYRLWTKELPEKQNTPETFTASASGSTPSANKPWWKFW
jgi:hypothetical protein